MGKVVFIDQDDKFIFDVEYPVYYERMSNDLEKTTEILQDSTKFNENPHTKETALDRVWLYAYNQFENEIFQFYNKHSPLGPSDDLSIEFVEEWDKGKYGKNVVEVIRIHDYELDDIGEDLINEMFLHNQNSGE